MDDEAPEATRTISRRSASILGVSWLAALLGCRKDGDGTGADGGSSPVSPVGTAHDAARVRQVAARVATHSEAEILVEARRIGPMVSSIVAAVGRSLAPGATTASVAERLVRESRPLALEPAMLGYGGFPAVAAVSVNDEIVHAPPSGRTLVAGDLVKIQYTVRSGAAFAAQGWTFPVGEPSAADRELLATGRRALERALAVVLPGSRVGHLSAAIQGAVEEAGLAVVREYVGYGMGKAMLQDPQIPGYGKAGRGVRLEQGWVLNLHAIVKRGTAGIRIGDDQWTAVAEDGERGVLCACTLEVTADGHRLLTPLL
ncbi:MAG: M24 family metallopeptidase [Polyangiaceae bacterium]